MSGGELIGWLRPEAFGLLLPWAGFMLHRLFRPGRRVVGTDGRGAPATDSPWRRVIDPVLLSRLSQPATSVPEAPSHGGFAKASAWQQRIASLLGLLLILALAGPQLKRPGAGEPPLRPDVARVLAVDLSPGFSPLDETARQRLRVDLRTFLRRLPAGETALMVVAGEAWLVVPPTEDVATLDGFIAELSPAVVPVAGDNPAAGLALARRTLAATGARQQAIYWLRAGDPPSFNAPAMPESGVQPKFLQATAGVDDWLSRARAPDDKAGTAGWRTSLLNLASPPDAAAIDLGPTLILLALPLAGWLLRGAGSLLAWPLIVLAGGVTPLPADAAPSAHERGVAEYRAGRYAAAAAAFAEQPANEARAHYNRGNALARAGRLQAALAAYDESLRLRPGDASTLHNREIVARLLQPPPNPPPPSPPPPSPPPPDPSSRGGAKPPPTAPQSAEAERAAEQWLRRPPSSNDGLLRRKLAIEEARRSGKGAP